MRSISKGNETRKDELISSLDAVYMIDALFSNSFRIYMFVSAI